MRHRIPIITLFVVDAAHTAFPTASFLPGSPLKQVGTPYADKGKRACVPYRCVTAKPSGRCAAYDALGLRHRFMGGKVDMVAFGDTQQHDAETGAGA